MAREAIAEHGMTFEDGHGVTRSRPEIQIERDARIQFARLVRELDLDTVAPPVADLGRPPGLRSNRREVLMGLRERVPKDRNVSVTSEMVDLFVRGRRLQKRIEAPKTSCGRSSTS